MQVQTFRNQMKLKTYLKKGVIKHYTDSAIENRLYCLRELEKFCNNDLDEKCVSVECGKQFLRDIRNSNLEDLRHTKLSNAFRHYFNCVTGLCIGRIF